MEGELAQMGQFIGAGLTAFGMGGAAIGVRGQGSGGRQWQRKGWRFAGAAGYLNRQLVIWLLRSRARL